MSPVPPVALVPALAPVLAAPPAVLEPPAPALVPALAAPVPVSAAFEVFLVSVAFLAFLPPPVSVASLVFLPPLGVRYFDLNRLAPYAVCANQMLVYDIHMLWTGIMNQFKEHSGLVDLQVTDLSKEL